MIKTLSIAAAGLALALAAGPANAAQRDASPAAQKAQKAPTDISSQRYYRGGGYRGGGYRAIWRLSRRLSLWWRSLGRTPLLGTARLRLSPVLSALLRRIFSVLLSVLCAARVLRRALLPAVSPGRDFRFWALGLVTEQDQLNEERAPLGPFVFAMFAGGSLLPLP